MVIDPIADYFGFSENNTNLKTETLAGITTFMTMSYIIMVIAKKSKEIHWLLYLITGLFLRGYVLV